MKKGIVVTIVLSMFLLACSSAIHSRRQHLGDVSETVVSGEIVEQPDIDDVDVMQNSGNKKVAVLLPLSGNAKTVGEVMLNSAQLALFEIRNPKITLMPFDTKGTSFGAIEAMNAAVAEDVDIVLGPLFSDSVKAITPIAKEHRIDVLSFSNNQDLVDRGAYLMGFSPEQQIERIVSYAIDQGYTSFAALVPNNNYGQTVSRVLKETAGRKDGKVVKVEFYFEDGSSLEKNVKRILDSYSIADRVYEEYETAGKDPKKEKEFIVEEEDKIYPDIILIPESGKKLAKIAQLIKEQNTSGRTYKLVGSGQWDNVETASDENLTGGWFVAPEPKYYYEFERKYYETYGSFPIRIASIPYDAVMVLNHIAKKSKTGFDKEAITYYKGFMGIDGIFRFLPNGIVERRYSVLEVEDGAFRVLDEPLYKFMDY